MELQMMLPIAEAALSISLVSMNEYIPHAKTPHDGAMTRMESWRLIIYV